MGLIYVNKEYFGNGVNIHSFFHYTFAEDIKIIIENSSIRFTHCAFLNDSEEYLYIDEILDEIITENTDEKVTDVIKTIKEKIDRNYEGIVLKANKDRYLTIASGEYYVLSGTTEQDSLPMWNYYVKSGNYFGYAIRLDVRKLYEKIKHLLPPAGEFLCGRVIYDRKEQKSIVVNYTRQLLNKIEQEEDTDRDDESLYDEFYSFIQGSRLFFKRDGFKHEKEFRIVILSHTEITEEGFSSGFGITQGLIKPYIEYAFKGSCLPITQITLSPTIEERIGKRGVEMILAKYQYDGVKVDKSNLKLRY